MSKTIWILIVAFVVIGLVAGYTGYGGANPQAAKIAYGSIGAAIGIAVAAKLAE